MNGMEYIRKMYGVPAKRGALIEYNGKKGVVTGTSGPHIMARLEGEKFSKVYHPTDLSW